MEYMVRKLKEEYKIWGPKVNLITLIMLVFMERLPNYVQKMGGYEEVGVSNVWDHLYNRTSSV